MRLSNYRLYNPKTRKFAETKYSLEARDKLYANNPNFIDSIKNIKKDPIIYRARQANRKNTETDKSSDIYWIVALILAIIFSGVTTIADLSPKIWIAYFLVVFILRMRKKIIFKLVYREPEDEVYHWAISKKYFTEGYRGYFDFVCEKKDILAITFDSGAILLEINPLLEFRHCYNSVGEIVPGLEDKLVLDNVKDAELFYKELIKWKNGEGEYA